MAKNLLSLALDNNINDLDSLKSLDFDGNMSVGEKLVEQTGVIGEKIEGLSESQIVDGLDSKGAGMGDYNIEISVTANSGSRPACQNSDSGETVTYTVQLIVLDYSISPYVDIDDIDVWIGSVE